MFPVCSKQTEDIQFGLLRKLYRKRIAVASPIFVSGAEMKRHTRAFCRASEFVYKSAIFHPYGAECRQDWKNADSVRLKRVCKGQCSHKF